MPRVELSGTFDLPEPLLDSSFNGMRILPSGAVIAFD